MIVHCGSRVNIIYCFPLKAIDISISNNAFSKRLEIKIIKHKHKCFGIPLSYSLEEYCQPFSEQLVCYQIQHLLCTLGISFSAIYSWILRVSLELGPSSVHRRLLFVLVSSIYLLMIIVSVLSLAYTDGFCFKCSMNIISENRHPDQIIYNNKQQEPFNQ